MVFEWSRQDERIAVGRIVAPDSIELQMIHYFPWNYKGRYRILPDGQVGGENLAAKKYFYLLWTNRIGNVSTGDQVSELIIPFVRQKDNSLYFVGGVGDDENILSDQMYRYKNIRLIDTILREEEIRYEKSRVKIDGFYTGVARSITNNLFWMQLYQPGQHRLYTPSGRIPKANQSLDHWTIFEWDSFFSALEVFSPFQSKINFVVIMLPAVSFSFSMICWS